MRPLRFMIPLRCTSKLFWRSFKLSRLWLALVTSICCLYGPYLLFQWSSGDWLSRVVNIGGGEVNTIAWSRELWDMHLQCTMMGCIPRTRSFDDIYLWTRKLDANEQEKRKGEFLVAGKGGNETDELNVQVHWVILAHLTGSQQRYQSIRQTWFRLTSPHVGLVAFGKRPQGAMQFDNPREKFIDLNSLQSNKDETAEKVGQVSLLDILQVLLVAFRSFPSARCFSIFDDGTYVYTRTLATHLGFVQSGFVRTSVFSTADYLGYPFHDPSFQRDLLPDEDLKGNPDFAQITVDDIGKQEQEEELEVMLPCVNRATKKVNDKTPSVSRHVFASMEAGFSLSRRAVRVLIGLLRVDAHGQVLTDENGLENLSAIGVNASTPGALGIGRCLFHLFDIQVVALPGHHPHNPWQMLRWDKYGLPKNHAGAPSEESFLRPVSYHFVDPMTMWRMHDDIYIYNLPLRRSRGIPKIIHQVWLGNAKFPPIHAMETCLVLHRDWDVRVWDDKRVITDMPPGGLVNQDLYDFFQQVNTQHRYAASDVLRYEFLVEHGGIYVDADSKCLQPMDLLLEGLYLNEDTNVNDGFAAYENEEWRSNVEGFMLVANGVMASVPFSPYNIALVRNLRFNDVKNLNLKPWRTVGPAFITRVYAKIQAKMTFLPSHAFYPIHFEAPRCEGARRRHHLLEKNSYMDQMWSSTRDAFGMHAPFSPRQLLAKRMLSAAESSKVNAHSMLSPSKEKSRLEKLLDNYGAVHEEALSMLALQNEHHLRWVVIRLKNGTSVSERVEQIASGLLLSVLTDRALLFDWPTYDLTNERGKGDSDGYLDVDFFRTFAPPPIAVSYREALEWFALIDEDVYNLNGFLLGSQELLSSESEDFLDLLRWHNMDSILPQDKVIFIDQEGFWGEGLFLNPHYQDLLSDLPPDKSLRLLFKYLFQPKEQGMKSDIGNCRLFAEIRGAHISPRDEQPYDCIEKADILVDVDNKCLEGKVIGKSMRRARKVGNAYGEKGTSAILSGSIYVATNDIKIHDALIRKYHHLSHVHILPQVCSGTPQCDQHYVSALHISSACTQKILAIIEDDNFSSPERRNDRKPDDNGSSDNQIIRPGGGLSLAVQGGKAVFDSSGNLRRCEHLSEMNSNIQRLDSAVFGASASQLPKEENSIVTTQQFRYKRRRDLRGAYLIVATDGSNTMDFFALRKALTQFQNSTNQQFSYPIVLLVDRVSKWRFLQFQSTVRLHIVQFDDPIALNGTTPWMHTYTHDRCDTVSATTFLHSLSILHILQHPYLRRQFDYVIRLDTQSLLAPPWESPILDPFHFISSRNLSVMFTLSEHGRDDLQASSHQGGAYTYTRRASNDRHEPSQEQVRHAVRMDNSVFGLGLFTLRFSSFQQFHVRMLQIGQSCQSIQSFHQGSVWGEANLLALYAEMHLDRKHVGVGFAM